MSESIVSHREWEASKPFSTDQISVQNLRLVANAGYDVWGRQKSQPIELSVTLGLVNSFSSAAATDSVDASTVHYGHLSKALLAAASEGPNAPWKSPHEFVQTVAEAAKQAAANARVISTLEIRTNYPKASRFGDGVGLLLCHRLVDELTSTVLFVSNIRVATIIGVNANEREMKQLVVITVAVDRISARISDRYFELEQLVAKVCSHNHPCTFMASCI